eukprot:Hpha_TRINITY_DN34342_c0_g1::TRINITY_DN34342_c0_g1_i1::g.109541::m.109541
MSSGVDVEDLRGALKRDGEPPRTSGMQVVPLSSTDSAEAGARLLALEEVLDAGAVWLSKQTHAPRCFCRYELSVAGPSALCVTFHCSGALSYVGSCAVRSRTPLVSAVWERGTIEGRWPLAKTPLTRTGVEQHETCLDRPLLHITCAPEEGATTASEIFLAFGGTHRGLVIDIRPTSNRVAPSISCHRMGDWPTETPSRRLGSGVGRGQVKPPELPT